MPRTTDTTYWFQIADADGRVLTSQRGSAAWHLTGVYRDRLKMHEGPLVLVAVPDLYETCAACSGSGQTNPVLDCGACQGRGETLVPWDRLPADYGFERSGAHA